MRLSTTWSRQPMECNSLDWKGLCYCNGLGASSIPATSNINLNLVHLYRMCAEGTGV